MDPDQVDKMWIPAYESTVLLVWLRMRRLAPCECKYRRIDACPCSAAAHAGVSPRSFVGFRSSPDSTTRSSWARSPSKQHAKMSLVGACGVGGEGGVGVGGRGRGTRAASSSSSSSSSAAAATSPGTKQPDERTHGGTKPRGRPQTAHLVGSLMRSPARLRTIVPSSYLTTYVLPGPCASSPNASRSGSGWWGRVMGGEEWYGARERWR